MKNSKNQKKWIGIVVVLLIFTVGFYTTTSGNQDKLTYSKESKPERKAKPVDKEDLPTNWAEMENQKELDRYYEDRTPGLKLAREHGLTTHPDQSTTIPNKDGRVQINEVWHSGNSIHIFYSIDLSLLVEKEKEKIHFTKLPAVNQVQIDPETKDIQQQNLGTFSRPLQFGEAVIFGNRLYSQIQTSPIFNDPENPQYNQFEAFDEKIPTTIEFRLAGKNLETNPVPVHYNYDPEGQILKRFTFDETYKKDGLTLQPLELVMGISNSHLKMKIIHKKADFNHSLTGSLQADNGLRFSILPMLKEDPEQKDVYRANIQPLQSIPDHLTLNIQSVHLNDNQSYSFRVDVSDYANDKSVPDRAIKDIKVATAYETNIFLNTIGSNRPQGIDLQLKYKPQNNEQMNYLVGYPQYNGKNTQRESAHIKSDNGKEYDTYYGGSDDGAFIPVENKYLEGASSLQITVNDIAYAQRVEHEFELETQQ